MRRLPRVATILVVALAVGLRFARLGWGLDEELFFADETVWVLRLRAFDTLGWKSFDTTGLGYPTLYQTIGGLGSWVLGLFGWQLRGAAGVGWMRIVAATMSVLAVAMIMRVGRNLYGPWVGIAAGALFAVAPFEVMQAHYASVEPLLLLCTTLVIAACWRLMQRGTLTSAAVAGAAVGLATGAKYPALAFFSAVLWAIVERWWQVRWLAEAGRFAAVAGLALIVSFALACPSCILHADVLVEMVDRHRMMSAFAAFQGACLVPQAGWWHRPWIYEIVASLPYGLGLPFALLAFAGVIAALWYRAPGDRLLLAMMLPFFAYIGWSSAVYPRYMLPLYPPLALLAAAGVARIARPRLATAIVAIAVAYGLALSVSQLARFSWDQQAAVADWLGDRLAFLSPEDRHVAVPAPEAPDPYFKLRKPLEAKGFKVDTVRKGPLFDGRPAFVVLPDWLAMVALRDQRDILLRGRVQQLQQGHAGYRPVLHIPSPSYLQRRWDTWWDPTFAVELWQGAIGFTVYARTDVLPDLKTVEVLPPHPPRRDPAATPPAAG